uniref:Ig-like domain-containing protein n=1 Tax=Propithecus coquereli TaxID=379532 RepID=A0A2K6FM49_PROCO
MEPPTAPPHRGRIPWQGLLLTVSLLTSWNPPATGQVTMESVPLSVVEGKDVLLLVHNMPQDTIGYRWYKGHQTDRNRTILTYMINATTILIGPEHTDRETIYSNGSLLFHNVTQEDKGYYTLHLISKNPLSKAVTGQFHVYHGPDVPTISPSDSYYQPGANLNLSCHAASNPAAQYSWLINGSLQQTTQELFIPNVTVNNSGSYACVAHNSATGHKRTTVKTITVKILVLSSPCDRDLTDSYSW